MTTTEMKSELEKLRQHLQYNVTGDERIPYSEIKEDNEMNSFYVELWHGKFKVEIDLEGDFLITYNPPPAPVEITPNNNISQDVIEFTSEVTHRVLEDSFDCNRLLNIMQTVYPNQHQFKK